MNTPRPLLKMTIAAARNGVPVLTRPDDCRTNGEGPADAAAAGASAMLMRTLSVVVRPNVSAKPPGQCFRQRPRGQCAQRENVQRGPAQCAQGISRRPTS